MKTSAINKAAIVLFVATAWALPKAEAQTVIWIGRSDSQTAAMGAAGLVDALIAEQQRLRTQPIVYRKLGTRPESGATAIVKVGDIVVRQVTYDASFLGCPKEDFVNSYGMPVARATMSAVKMVNSAFCYPSGSRCFFDKDRDGDWDGAGLKPSGRPVDVPYEVLELRRERSDGPTSEMILQEATLLGARLAEKVRIGDGVADGAQACEASPAAPEVSCGGFRIMVLEFGEGWIRYQVAATSKARKAAPS